MNILLKNGCSIADQWGVNRIIQFQGKGIHMKNKMSLLVLAAIFSLFTSCGSQTDMVKIPGVQGPHFNVQDGKILLSLSLENVHIDLGATVPIPRMENSDVTLTPLLEGGTMIQIAFDPQDVDNEDFRVVPASTLPDGRAFPFTAGGTLPALALNTPRFLDATFYASDKLFGFFIPVKYGLDINAFSRIKINGKQVGIATIIKPNAQGSGSGVMIVLTLDALEDNQLQKLLKISSKNAHKIY